ncbi:MAG: S-layer homology domain-containing protein [Clostridia bacterium]|nr:S-layer homology domain-containing protein [Clostridia bacterium]
MRVMIIVILMNLISFVTADVMIQTETLPTSDQLFEMALNLEEKYPEILDLEILGYSTDDKPIYVLRLSSNISEITSAEAYVDKYHYFVEGGIHSRENVSPLMLLKIVELYAADYYNPEMMPSIDMQMELDRFAFHFMILSNPDGYDLANFGLQEISSPYKENLLSFSSHNFSQYKSNINGVDLNRNFPGVYYDSYAKSFVDIWNQVKNEDYSNNPGRGYYYGPYAGSEVETRLLMGYVTSYDFRNYISFHSRGEVIYYNKWMLSDAHNQGSYTLANQIAKYNGFEPIYTGKETSGSGYLTDFTAMTTLKPSITIETLPGKTELPVSVYTINKVFKEQLLVPLIAAYEGKRSGYFDYKLYINNYYVRDYPTEEIAKAFANRYGGKIYTYEGKPSYIVPLSMVEITRRQGITLLYVKLDLDTKDRGEVFLDCDDPFVLAARKNQIITGFNNMFNPNQLMTYEEAYVILAKFLPEFEEIIKYEYKTTWAKSAVEKLLTAGIISSVEIKSGIINYLDWNNLILKVENLSNEE